MLSNLKFYNGERIGVSDIRSEMGDHNTKCIRARLDAALSRINRDHILECEER